MEDKELDGFEPEEDIELEQFLETASDEEVEKMLKEPLLEE